MSAETKGAVALRTALALLAALLFLSSLKILSSNWYTATVENSVVTIDGDAAWSGFSAIITFQAAAVGLGNFFRRTLALIVLGINAAISITFVVYATLAFQSHTPSSVELIVVKATGIAGGISQISNSGLAVYFVALQFAGTVALAATTLLKARTASSNSKPDRFSRGTKATNATDSISLWDSQA